VRTLSSCDYARDRHRDFVRWRNLWTILLFTFGWGVVLFLLAAIFLFIRQTWLGAAISTLGTMATGAAVTWVTSRRAEAVTEEEKAYRDVIEQCTQPTPTRAETSPQPALMEAALRQELSAITKRFILFGNVR
jgi:hypothetical protein